MQNEKMDLVLGIEGQSSPNTPLKISASMTAAVRELQARGVPRTQARALMHRLFKREIVATEIATKSGNSVAISRVG